MKDANFSEKVNISKSDFIKVANLISTSFHSI